jgi:hypothetical protein
MTLDLKDIPRLEKIAHDVHQNAVDKGWWPLTPGGKADWNGRNVGEILILATSELAEALEVWRDGKPLVESWKGEKGKPEGFPIEMADFVIRVIETMVACGSQFEVSFKIAIGCNALDEAMSVVRKREKTDKPNVGNELMAISALIADAYLVTLMTGYRADLIWTEGSSEALKGFSLSLASAVMDAFKQAHRIGYDLWKAIEEKHAYNKTRPVRHGGKLA